LLQRIPLCMQGHVSGEYRTRNEDVLLFKAGGKETCPKKG